MTRAPDLTPDQWARLLERRRAAAAAARRIRPASRSERIPLSPRYVPDPFACDGSRLYRTGDLATPSGKLDRAALSAIQARPARGRPGSASRMTWLWAEVLGVPEVHDDDDYFALGGTSLLAPRLTAAVREAFGVELPIHALFECPTPALLATYLTEGNISR
jgi:hypothetical protein